MPSGFVQDTNQLSPNLYRVVIDLSGYPTTDGNTNGAVSPTSSDNVGSGVNQISAKPTSLAAGKQRARGNMRFRNIINRLSGIGDCQILDVEVGGQTDGDSQATSLAFTVKYERPQDLLNAIRTAVFAESGSYNNAGSVAITTILLGLEELVVRGVRDATTANARVYNGTAGTDNQLSITVEAPDTASNVLTDVTVALIDGTELTTADEAGSAE
jgi:hypothetical protein